MFRNRFIISYYNRITRCLYYGKSASYVVIFKKFLNQLLVNNLASTTGVCNPSPQHTKPEKVLDCVSGNIPNCFKSQNGVIAVVHPKYMQNPNGRSVLYISFFK